MTSELRELSCGCEVSSKLKECPFHVDEMKGTQCLNLNAESIKLEQQTASIILI